MSDRTVRPRHSRRFVIWLLSGLFTLAVLGLLAALSLTGRSLEMPGWVTARVEARINAALAPMRLTLGGMDVVFSDRLVPRVHLTDVTVADAGDRPLARMPDLSLTLIARPLLGGSVMVRRVALNGAELTLRRGADGQFDIALGNAVAPTMGAGSLGEVLGQIDNAFALPGLASVQGVSIEDLHLKYVDARAGRSWQVDGGLMTLDQTATDVSARLFFSLTNDMGVPSEVAMSFDTVKGSPETRMSANFSDMPSSDIATQSPALTFLKVIDAPISGALRTGVDADGSLAPLNAALEIGAGALRPVEEAAPIRFDRGKSYFTYNPAQDKITFDEISVDTDAVRVQAEGHAYLRDQVNGWPTSLVAQFQFRQVALSPRGVFEEPAVFTGGAADLKLALDPFTATIGQVVLTDETGADYRGSGSVRARPDGWQVDLDLALNRITDDRLLALWPVDLVPRTREWVSDNVQGGLIFDVKAALRLAADKAPVAALTYEFRDATVRFMKTMPPVENGYGYSTIQGKTFTLVLDSGTVTAPSGGTVDAAGTVMRVPDITQRPATGEITLNTESSVEAVLSVLDQPPLEIMSRAGQPVDLVDGRARMKAVLRLPLKDGTQPKDVRFSVAGTLNGISSRKIVPGRVLEARSLSLSADNEQIAISGEAQLDGVPVQGVWTQAIGAGTEGQSRVEGTVELSQRALDAFNIGLPRGSVSGRGVGNIALDLKEGQPTKFTLTSDLNRVGLRLDGAGWSKPAGEKGSLRVTGSLGAPPVIDSLALSGPGLDASGGSVSIAAD
ncbi:MAG: DUF3971 domain-containing protein, partial [Paracoccaceae bacterium]